MRSFDRVIELLKQSGWEFPVSTEVFLEQDSTQKEFGCYIVDHATRALFRVDTMIKDHTGQIEPTSTQDYWTHVEHFPMHNLYPLEAEEELMAMLGHGLIDDKTAPTSTTPFSAKEAKNFLRALEIMRNNMTTSLHDGYRLCAVARLWSMIARSRYVNSYSLGAPRLDRLQDIGASKNRGVCHRFQTWPDLFLDTHKTTFKRLHNPWHERVVYQRDWQAFFEDIRRETLRTWIASSWIGLLCLALPTAVPQDLVTTACGIAITGVWLTLALHKIYGKSGVYVIVPLEFYLPLPFQYPTSHIQTEYLVRVESYGLQPLSVFLSLPYVFPMRSIFAVSAALAAVFLWRTFPPSFSPMPLPSGVN